MHDVVLELGFALVVCVQFGLSGPHLAPPPEPVAWPPLTVSAFGMYLHATATVDGLDCKQLETPLNMRDVFGHRQGRLEVSWRQGGLSRRWHGRAIEGRRAATARRPQTRLPGQNKAHAKEALVRVASAERTSRVPEVMVPSSP